MIRLNVNEINEIDSRRNFSQNGQPREYNSEEELIEWLKYNLYRQALLFYNAPDENGIITIRDEDEKKYSLNIGNNQYTINIDFDLSYIINDFINTIENKNYLNYNIHILNINLNSLFNLPNIIYNGNFILEKVSFYKRAIFNNSIYNGSFYISQSKFYQTTPLEIRNIELNDFFSFYQNELNNLLYIINSNFNSLSYFSNNVNKFSIKFKNSTINNIIRFDKSRFRKLEFILITFNGTINFTSSIIEKLIFTQIQFKNKDSILLIENNNYDSSYNSFIDNIIHSIDFKYIRISGMVYFQNINIQEIDLKGSVIDGGILNPINFKVEKFANRESALFLKQQAIANHNYIDALQYQAEEVRLHKEELLQKLSEDKLKIKTVGDIASIYLSSLFSDNGVNWIRALAMTILSTLVLFTIFYFPDLPTIMRMVYKNDYSLLCNYFYKDFFEDFIRYIIPTEYDLVFNYAKNYKSTNFFKFLIKICGVITYFTGKIAFWYGSFHTVSAFRKFNRSL